jgi:hypothetical protein
MPTNVPGVISAAVAATTPSTLLEGNSTSFVDPVAVVTVIDVGVTAAIVPRTRVEVAAEAPGEAAGEFVAAV